MLLYLSIKKKKKEKNKTCAWTTVSYWVVNININVYTWYRNMELLYQHKHLTDALGLIIWKCFLHMLLVSLHPLQDRKCLLNTVKVRSKLFGHPAHQLSTVHTQQPDSQAGHILKNCCHPVAGFAVRAARPREGAQPLSPKLCLLLLNSQGLPGL